MNISQTPLYRRRKRLNQLVMLLCQLATVIGFVFLFAILFTLVTKGIGAISPSTTRIGGRLAIRVNLTNHRTRFEDLDVLVAEVKRIGEEATAGGAAGDSAAVVSAEGQDGAGHYELAGFISHIGKSVTSGHYVCHLKKEGRWLVFNDEKVQECPDPPLECGYLYFYRRRA